MRKNNKSFTLMEMLVVMAIMGLILAISVPAFDSVIKTSKVSEGAKLVYKTLQFASQYAVTNGVNCRVVFATSEPRGSSSSYTMARRAYKVLYELTPPPNPTYRTIEDWQFLFNSTSIDSNTSNSTMLNDTVSMPFPDDNSVSDTVAYVEFNSTGRSAQGATIRIIDSNNNATFREITYTTAGLIRLKDLGET